MNHPINCPCTLRPPGFKPTDYDPNYTGCCHSYSDAYTHPTFEWISLIKDSILVYGVRVTRSYIDEDGIVYIATPGGNVGKYRIIYECLANCTLRSDLNLDWDGTHTEYTYGTHFIIESNFDTKLVYYRSIFSGMTYKSIGIPDSVTTDIKAVNDALIRYYRKRLYWLELGKNTDRISCIVDGYEWGWTEKDQTKGAAVVFSKRPKIGNLESYLINEPNNKGFTESKTISDSMMIESEEVIQFAKSSNAYVGCSITCPYIGDDIDNIQNLKGSKLSLSCTSGCLFEPTIVLDDLSPSTTNNSDYFSW